MRALETIKGILKRVAVWVVAILIFLLCVFLLSRGLRKLDTMSYPMKYSDFVEKYSEQYGVDPLLIYAIIRAESNFDPYAQSSVDARGLMQVTGPTFAWIKNNIAPEENLTFDSMYDPETNIRFGVYYYSRCLARYGADISTASAAYFSGWGTVDALVQQSHYSQDRTTLVTFPYNQMRKYVHKVNDNYKQYKKLYGQQVQAENPVRVFREVNTTVKSVLQSAMD